MYKWFVRFTLVTVIGLSCAVGASSPARANDPVPRFEPGECPAEIARPDLECGWLIVPEDRSDPDSSLIRLAVGTLRRGEADNTPVVYLHGGPGAGALHKGTIDLMRYLFSSRDVIFLDQRGCGYSEPSLACPPVENPSYGQLTEPAPDREALNQRYLDTLADCRDFLTEQGINLAAYDTASNAADIADLRVALGYDEWHMFGVSYGTRLALTVMRDHPEGIGQVILDSVYPLMPDKRRSTMMNIPDALDTLFERCAADELCARQHPTLADDFFAQVERADAQPLAVEVEPGVTYYASGDMLAKFVISMIYQGDTVPMMAKAVAELANGDLDSHKHLLANASEKLYLDGLTYSVACREVIPFTSDEVMLADLANVHPALRPEIEFTIRRNSSECEVWDVPPGDPIENEWVRSDIPTLVITGSLDPITPPVFAYGVAEHLTNHELYEFPDLGHGVLLRSTCAQRLASRFLDDPATLSEINCY